MNSLEMFYLVARQLIVMALIAAISFIFSKRNDFGEKESQCVSRLLMYVINPCVIISSYNIDFNMERFKELGLVVLLSFIFHFLMSGIAVAFIRDKMKDNVMDGLDRLAVVFTNSGFIGIPLISGVFGPDGVFYLMGYILAFNIYIWIWGEYMMTGKINLLKIITNPNVISCFAGVILFILPVKLPYVVGQPLKMISDCNGATSMILLGMLFASFKRSGFKDEFRFRIGRVAVLRLFVCPVILLALLLIVMKVTGTQMTETMKLALNVIYIAALCPAGMSVSGFAVIFGKDSAYASLIIILTSALCIITVPAFVSLSVFLQGLL